MNDDYKISLKNCRNGHNIENILISEFAETQKINISKIICDNCKINNMAFVFDNIFYWCINCRKNLCPLCKNVHYTNHNIIKYENRNYICEEHGEQIINYCNDCKMNLCFSCEEKHNEHNITDLKKLKKKNSEIENELSKFREYIDKAKDLIDKDIKAISDNCYY